MENILKLGDRVEIISDCQSKGKIGIIVGFTKRGQSSVFFNREDGWHRSEQLSFSGKSLRVVNEEEEVEEMKEVKENFVVLLKVEPIYYVEEYSETKSLLVRCYDKNVKVGDQVIIDCSDLEQEHEVIEIFSDAKYKHYDGEVVTIVNYSNWKQRKELDEELGDIENKIFLILKGIDCVHIDIKEEKEVELKVLTEKLLELLKTKYPTN